MFSDGTTIDGSAPIKEPESRVSDGIVGPLGEVKDAALTNPA
jgi:hypothetical protein